MRARCVTLLYMIFFYCGDKRKIGEKSELKERQVGKQSILAMPVSSSIFQSSWRSPHPPTLQRGTPQVAQQRHSAAPQTPRRYIQTLKSSGNNLTPSFQLYQLARRRLTLLTNPAPARSHGPLPLELLPWQPITQRCVSPFSSPGCSSWLAEVVYPNYKNPHL